ncbi:hypothetical protein C8Q80DRAFT_1142269 [Daedaleopsis nitida]|nr:hypothetical protein C8Q80DRAFT_1142269 [Daedaleopsis nitida]
MSCFISIIYLSTVSESLAILADLQEFGIPGHEVPIPTLPGPSSKRFSDASMVLSSLNEEEVELDFSNIAPASTTSSPVIGPGMSRPAPSMSLAPSPNVPQFSRSRRMGSLDALAPLDVLGDGDIITLKSLPVPRRMASIDTISPQSSSSRDGRGERTLLGHMSSASYIPPPPPPQPHPQSFLQPMVRPTSRPFSIMSQSTEQDLLAIAEMLSPTIDATIEEEEPIPETPTELENNFSDMYIYEPAANPSNAGTSSLNSSASSIYSAYQRAPSMRSSMYTDSDGASYMGDELPADPTFLVPLPHGYRNLNLPRGSLPMPPLDDSRSVSSSASYSSLRTPSLSRAPSLAYLSSPPISPDSSHSPIDMPPPYPFSTQNSKMLGIIEESMHAEEDHHHYHRQHADETETVSPHGDMESEQNHSSRSYVSSSYFDRRPTQQTRSPVSSAYKSESRAESRAESRTEMRSPVHSLYKSDSGSDLRSNTHSLYKSDSRSELRNPVHTIHKSDSRGELRSPQRGEARSDARNDTRGGSPHFSNQANRRGPELQRLQISKSVPSSTSATPPDLIAPSPFGNQRPPYGQQSHSAYPSYTQPQPRQPAPEQHRSSYAEKRAGIVSDRSPLGDEEHSPSVYEREMQAPFGKLRSAYSVELLSAAFNAGSIRARESPVVTQSHGSPRYAPPVSEAEKYADKYATVRTHNEWLPPPPPVPLEPVMSASSGSSGQKSMSKKKGLGKFFSRGSGGASINDKSSVHYSNQSVSSFDTGMSKDEAKRIKKEAARARTERLAQDLAEKAKLRAAEAKAKKEVVVREKSKKPWEEGGGMYEGITYL